MGKTRRNFLKDLGKPALGGVMISSPVVVPVALVKNNDTTVTDDVEVTYQGPEGLKPDKVRVEFLGTTTGSEGLKAVPEFTYTGEHYRLKDITIRGEVQNARGQPLATTEGTIHQLDQGQRDGVELRFDLGREMRLEEAKKLTVQLAATATPDDSIEDN